MNEYSKESTVYTVMSLMNIYICISCSLTDMEINGPKGTYNRGGINSYGINYQEIGACG